MSICHTENEIHNEQTQNAYNTTIVKAVLLAKIQQTHNINTLARLLAQVTGYEPHIVTFVDYSGQGLAYPKEYDPIQQQLAKMAMEKILFEVNQ